MDQIINRVFDPKHIAGDYWYAHGVVYQGDMMCRLEAKSHVSHKWDIHPLPDVYYEDYPQYRGEEERWKAKGYDTRTIYLMDPVFSMPITHLIGESLALFAMLFLLVAGGLCISA